MEKDYSSGNENDLPKGHEYFMEKALSEAGNALEAGEFPVGCVMVYRGMVVATGSRKNSSQSVNEMDHAEMVALRLLLEKSDPKMREEVTVYSTMEPCLMCFSTLIVNGLRRFVYSYEDAMGGGTNLPLEKLSPLYRDLDIEIIPDVLRSQSLKLFKSFFNNPDNLYLKNSLLEECTLAAD